MNKLTKKEYERYQEMKERLWEIQKEKYEN